MFHFGTEGQISCHSYLSDETMSSFEDFSPGLMDATRVIIIPAATKMTIALKSLPTGKYCPVACMMPGTKSSCRLPVTAPAIPPTSPPVRA